MIDKNQSGATMAMQHIAFSNLYSEPTFSVKRGKSWIEFGEDNLLPEYTIGLLDKSPDHSAIVIGTIQFAQGNGLIAPTEPRAEALFRNDSIDVTNPNNLNAIQAKLISDLVVHGACLLNVRWRSDNTAIADVHYVDVRTMRIDSDHTGYWISPDWSNIRKNAPEFFPAFDQKTGGSQLLYVKMPSPRPFPYGMPSYWSSRQAIELQYELMTFNLNRTKNNFFASVLLSFDDIPKAEEQQLNHDAMKKFFGGSKGENVGGAMTMYGGGVTVNKFESSTQPDDFFLMQKVADERIRSAHRVTGRGDLFGLGREGGGTFGSKEDLLNEFEAYSQVVVRPIQNVMISLWNMLAEINSIDHQFEIDPFYLFDEGKIGEATTVDPTPSGLPADASAAVAAVDAPVASSVAETALNGAQIDSLLNIITQVTAGTISKETALPLIRAAFPTISIDVIQAMLNGTNQTPPPAI